MIRIARSAGVLAFMLLTMARALACGAEGAACVVPLGEYRMALPAGTGTARPALVFLHGYGDTAAAILSRSDMIRAFTSHGYVVIAPQGLVRPERGRTGWYFRADDPPQRDELAFVRQVLADAAGRSRIDRARVLLAGESLGGSLSWYLACRAPGDFAGVAPVNGGFWNPPPTRCAGPVRLLHTHGWTDATVPLEGRIIRDVAIQGDIFAGLAVWRSANGCAAQAPTASSTDDNAWRRRWTACAPGSWLELVLHPGGHSVPDWWAPMTRAWFEAVAPP